MIISTTPGFLTAPARALQEGLAKRKRAGLGGGEPWFIHTSGTSNVGSRPVSGAWLDDGSPQGRVFDDAVDDVYEYEAARNAVEPYIQRTAEKAVVDAGLELDVRTCEFFTPIFFLAREWGGGGVGLISSVYSFTSLALIQEFHLY